MATRRGIAPRHVGVRQGVDARPARLRPLAPAETAWLLIPPALVVAVAAIALLGPAIGGLVPDTTYTYWPSLRSRLEPKPTELARFGLAIVCSLTVAGALLPAMRRRPHAHPAPARIGVIASQALCVGLIAVCWFAQQNVAPYDTADPEYFTVGAVVFAGLFAALTTLALTRIQTVQRLRTTLSTASWPRIWLAAAATVTIVWLLPSIFTDADVAYANRTTASHIQFTYDEAMSVLDGRSPLVNMATYGALVPYLVALPLAALEGTLVAFTTLMVALTASTLLAAYAILRRLARSALAALALYVPFVALSLFVVRGDGIERFTFASYFGMFPIRYAGPYLLAWLTVRHLDDERPHTRLPLFAMAGLVVLNNSDFGLPALGATLIAVVCARPPRERAALRGLAGHLVGGLAIALALVSLLTLARAGTLPHLDRLFAYARLFGVAGYENLPTPLLGFHLVLLATFVAALVTAAVRLAQRDDDAALTGMLAWCGVFGLGTGGYYIYRSHPDTLIASFSIWSLTTSVLVIAYLRDRMCAGALQPSIAGTSLLVALGIGMASVAHVPLPWQQAERIARDSEVRLLEWEPAARFVAEHIARGETAAILTPLGHRIGYELGVRNVMAYAGMTQMPTVDQLQETIETLRKEGGSLIFLGEQYPPEVPAELEAAGFRMADSDPSSQFTLWHDEG
jgi:hypothetical protein